MDTLIIFGGAITAGLIAGVMGLGGGVLIIPALTIFVGVPIKQAVGISLTSVIATSMSSSTVYFKKDLVDMKVGILLAMSAVAGGLSGGILGGYVSSAHLAFLFSAILIYSAVSLALKKEKTQLADAEYSRKTLWVFLVISYFAGILTGMLGIGGGVVFIPLLYLGLRMPMPIAIGTSAFKVGLTATAGAMIYFMRGDLDSVLSIIPPVVVGMIVGARVGGMIGVKIKSSVTKALFSLMLVYFSYRMFSMGLSELAR